MKKTLTRLAAAVAALTALSVTGANPANAVIVGPLWTTAESPFQKCKWESGAWSNANQYGRSFAFAENFECVTWNGASGNPWAIDDDVDVWVATAVESNWPNQPASVSLPVRVDRGSTAYVDRALGWLYANGNQTTYIMVCDNGADCGTPYAIH